MYIRNAYNKKTNLIIFYLYNAIIVTTKLLPGTPMYKTINYWENIILRVWRRHITLVLIFHLIIIDDTILCSQYF